MKKLGLFLFAAFLVSLIVSPSFALRDQDDFYSPWQFLCETASGTNSAAYVTLEALNSDQNVFIDQVIVKTDKDDALLTITTYAPTATAWSVTAESTKVELNLKDMTGATASAEVQTLGSGNPLIPLWLHQPH